MMGADLASSLPWSNGPRNGVTFLEVDFFWGLSIGFADLFGFALRLAAVAFVPSFSGHVSGASWQSLLLENKSLCRERSVDRSVDDSKSAPS